VILEVTGDLETPVASALATAGIAVAIVNPRKVRHFARATVRLAKTDRLDAEVLARFGEVVRPEARPLVDEQAQAFEALVTRRRQLVEMLTGRRIAGPGLQRFYTVASMSTSSGWKSDFRASMMNTTN
jgi:transposase